MRPSAIDDGVVGAAHGGDEVGRGRRQRRGGDAVDDVVERKVQLVRLVQRDFEAARGDLHRAGQARGRRIDEGEAVGLELAGLGHFLDQGRRRRAVGFEHQHRAIGLVAIIELVEQFFGGADGAGRT